MQNGIYLLENIAPPPTFHPTLLEFQTLLCEREKEGACNKEHKKIS